MKSGVKMSIIILLRLFMRMLYIFPIRENRVIFNAYRGSQYSCNPKYLSEYLLEHFPGQFEIIWAFNNPDNFRWLEEKGICLVRFNSLKRFYYEATCKISINNVGSYSWMPKRKRQEHVNTWHGGFELKKCGLSEIANDRLMKKTIQLSSDETSILISTSKKYDNDAAIKDLGFKRDTLKIGYPRNDILFKQKKGEVNIRKKVCSYFNIDESSHLILYAPTWRYNLKKEINKIDYSKLKETFEEKTGKSVVILTRMHHLMMNDMGDLSRTINATAYPDMQELLAVVDCLITDYSSCIWDFSIMEKPIYLFVPDIDEYNSERGLHINIYDTGFPICKTNSELFDTIKKMDKNTEKEMAVAFQENNGSYEKGEACEKFWHYIINLQNINREVSL